ncbi:hypothetical protein B1A87_007655 [Arthrobacter sp. KBS0703]|uniref:hypothetical protein n=1 Tax=Arthrobacter sp. KBS0703 TaxID=1955698 RepID=UPI00098FBA01|nr:hypothetical protein [Arthrobacter sp. KBS0703]TSE15792.1 hypothetical protein B1A87_007655 [Arthrobacter sp. KBS0703]
MTYGSDLYPRGGNLYASRTEIETAIELTIGDATETYFVYTREEADALPDRETILTPGGITFRKWDDYDEPGVAVWTRWLNDPIRTDGRDKTLRFLAKVLNTAPGNRRCLRSPRHRPRHHPHGQGHQ